MKITILCVGKIKEKFYRDALDEYIKRMSRYAKVEIIEVQDEKTPDGASEVVETAIKEKEGERILAKWDESSYTFVLAINGKQFSSEEFADKLAKLGTYGTSHVQFIIGGSLGLSEKVIKKADSLLSFSKMTFPHQLMRVVLMEQIYRAYRIIKNEPYHK
ncbi:MAG: 23S rRNA (pseudouridine(1915)-N(3))-methyltransferase RlmH [Lachnospiraceae bacterium]|nr:23S rRNA (pseudouridine(1915)-N(3))-methyltransferase RlmH [Lachnospiraceae bacterium]